MADLARRFTNNPIISPEDVIPSQDGLQILGLFNPGVFYFENKIWLIVRVAENVAEEDTVFNYIYHQEGEHSILKIAKDDPNIDATDPRVHLHQGTAYLTSLSHLRLFYSADGRNFEPSEKPFIVGEGIYEAYGIEDCRVSVINQTFYLTYTAVSSNGVCVGLRTTRDWKSFNHHGIIFPPHNKDCAIFEEKIGNKYYAFHRPSSLAIGGNYIWLSESPDGLHWGKHHCIIKTRAGMWDSGRVGAGAAPIRTEKGWLAVYHGADHNNLYCLGAVLLDLDKPWIVLARSYDPIMIPTAPYELEGFFNNVVFTNGHYWDGKSDGIKVYYGAADKYICGAEFKISEILSSLQYSL